MLYANSPDNQKISATPNTTATCPFCKATMIPKCGSINIWHWAHDHLIECDKWLKSETEWHLNWKSHFPKENTEVILSKCGVRHIADYYNQVSNITIEFQNSNISLDKRIERELFYPNLIWIINIKNKDGLELEWQFEDDPSIRKYRWKKPIRWFTEYPNKACNYFLDDFPQEDQLFQITNFYHNRGFERNDYGWFKYHHTFIDGVAWEKSMFISRMNDNLKWW